MPDDGPYGARQYESYELGKFDFHYANKINGQAFDMNNRCRCEGLNGTAWAT